MANQLFVSYEYLADGRYAEACAALNRAYNFEPTYKDEERVGSDPWLLRIRVQRKLAIREKLAQSVGCQRKEPVRRK